MLCIWARKHSDKWLRLLLWAQWCRGLGPLLTTQRPALGALSESGPFAFLQSVICYFDLFCVLSDAVVAGRLPEPLVNLRPVVTSAESCHSHPYKFPKHMYSNV